MAGIMTAIELTDGMTAPLMNIMNSVNLLVSSFENMNSVTAGSVDTSSIEGAREQIDMATMAFNQMEEAAENAARLAGRTAPTPIFQTPASTGQPVPVPVEWQTQSHIEIFDGNGAGRMTAEMASLNSMTENVLASQRRIGEQALQMDLLPPNASWDINFTNQRIEELGQTLTNLQSQDISLMDDASVARFNSEFEGMRSNMNTVINLQEQMNQAIDDGDISALNAGYNQLNSVVQQVERQIRTTQETMNRMSNIQWQSPNNIEVFTGGGMARYEQEIASANQMLNQVTQNQQRIASMSNQTDIFPDNMLADLQTMDARIQGLRDSISQIDNNPINDIGADAVNNDVETLRHQLSQAITLQNELSSAMEQMDVSAANAAYTRLNHAVASTEVHIRENMNAQNQFNSSVQQGGSMMDGLKGRIGAALAVYASFRGIKKVLDISDTMAQTTARLNLMNDGLQTTQALQDMIFLSAQRSRSEYAATADIVAKLGQRAGDVFSSNVETIQFAENLNKQFVIAGTSAQEISSASLQLTQALGSGVLRGEELNAVYEAAPNIIQTIADYLNVPIEKIREMASNGEITADVMKNAMLSATEEINAQFETMPRTFGQVVTSIQNNALMAFQPVLDQLNQLANSAGFDSLILNITGALVVISGALVVISGIINEIFNMVAQVAGFIAENWSILEPLILGAATALGIYTAALLMNKGIQLAGAAASGISATATAIHTAFTSRWTIATFAQTVAQQGLNAALRACPLTWILMIIIVIISVFYAAIAAVNKFAGTSYSATGIICGVFMVAAAAIGNVLVALINFAIDIFVVLWNFIASFVNFFANVFTDPVGAIAGLFFDLVDTVLSLLQSLVGAIDTIFGSNLSGAVQGWRDSLSGWVDDEYGDTVDVVAELNAADLHLDRFEYGSAWNAGNSFGQGLEDSIKNKLEIPIPDTSNQLNNPATDGLPFSPDAAGGGLGSAADRIPADVSRIADNTANLKDDIGISKEDLRFLREIAERQAINKFTTAEIKLSMSSQATIKNDMDLDGFLSKIEETIIEGVLAGAEGVHI